VAFLRTLFHRLAGQQDLSHRDMLLSSLAALIAMGVVTWISYRFLSPGTAPFIVASMGASTVLLVAIPSSPMNRAWPLLGSHLICAGIGVTCALYIPNPLLAIPLAVTGAVLAMQYLRCLHPPGGATAMLTVLAGPDVTQLGYLFVFTPVLLNAVILYGAVRGMAILLQRRPRQDGFESPLLRRDEEPRQLNLKPPFEDQDLDHALQHFDTFIDVNRNDLMRLYQEAGHHYHRRHLGDLRCSDVMIPSPLAAEFATPLDEAWAWLGRHRTSAIPVINCAQHVIGIVTLEDFIRHARDYPQAALEQRIQALIKPTPGPDSDKPEVVGQIMSHPVITAPENSHIAELLPLLDEKHIRHLPIVNDKAKLVGVLNRDQIVSLLQPEVAPDPA
jgi:CBS domain-containing membrane protein